MEVLLGLFSFDDYRTDAVVSYPDKAVHYVCHIEIVFLS